MASFHGSDFNAAKIGDGDEGLVCKTLVQLYDEAGNVLLSDGRGSSPGPSTGTDEWGR